MKRFMLVLSMIVLLPSLQGCFCCKEQNHHARLKAVPLHHTAQVPEQSLVYFDYNSTEITQDFEKNVAEIADYLNHHQGLKISLEGHTDIKGSHAFNDKLGQKRAEAIASALENHGVSKDKMAVKSFGKRHPATSDKDQAMQAANRRVLLSIAESSMVS